MATSSEWAEEIRQLYLSDAANQFVVYGNVNDRLLIESDDGEAKIVNFGDFLTQNLLKKFELVLS